MTSVPKCPHCNSEYTYQSRELWVCSECGHEWNLSEEAKVDEASSGSPVICDAHGNPLKDGDSVSVIKDLKVKGSSSVVKVGTKVKNIRLIDSEDGHNISCKIEGFGAMNLKSEFVKKS